MEFNVTRDAARTPNLKYIQLPFIPSSESTRAPTRRRKRPDGKRHKRRRQLEGMEGRGQRDRRGRGAEVRDGLMEKDWGGWQTDDKGLV